MCLNLGYAMSQNPPKLAKPKAIVVIYSPKECVSNVLIHKCLL